MVSVTTKPPMRHYVALICFRYMHDLSMWPPHILWHSQSIGFDPLFNEIGTSGAFRSKYRI